MSWLARVITESEVLPVHDVPTSEAATKSPHSKPGVTRATTH